MRRVRGEERKDGNGSCCDEVVKRRHWLSRQENGGICKVQVFITHADAGNRPNGFVRGRPVASACLRDERINSLAESAQVTTETGDNGNEERGERESCRLLDATVRTVVVAVAATAAAEEP